MLVISRKIGEELKIGDDIVLKIINVDKNQVKIGIEAPKNITILRMELVKEVTKQNKLAIIDDDVAIFSKLSRIFKKE